MGLMQQAYDTYCAMEPQYAGIYGKANVNANLKL